MDGLVDLFFFFCVCVYVRIDTPAQSAPFVSFTEGKVHDVRCLEFYLFIFLYTFHSFIYTLLLHFVNIVL